MVFLREIYRIRGKKAVKFIPKGISILCFLFIQSFSHSQTVFWTETFDGTLCGLPGNSGCDPSIVAWTTTNTGGNGASANKFYVSCTENGGAVNSCGAGCGANQTLHLGNVSTSAAAFLFCPTGDCGAAYDASGATEVTNKRCESPVINCTGYSGLSVSFLYMERGQTTLDNASIYYYNGTVWALLEDMPKTSLTGCSPQGKWIARTVALPASANNNANVRIGFLWVNNGDGTGSDPSFAVNNVTVAYTTLLPITLKYFTAKLEDDFSVKLEWQTETETNNDFFTVERSSDGEQFEPVLIKRGAGTSNIPITYSDHDAKPLNNISYYRLKQTDFNGEFSYSNIVPVHVPLHNGGEFLVYPNPGSDEITIQFEFEDVEVMQSTILDIRGSVIRSVTLNNTNKGIINISDLTEGIYFIELNVDGIISRKRIVVSR